AQNKPAKGVKQIFIENNKTADENFTFISKYLVKEGIEIQHRDKELGTINTGTFTMPKSHPIALMFFCENGSIRITGKFNSEIDLNFGAVTLKDDWEPIVNKGMKGSVYNKAFGVMNRFALKLSPELNYK